MLFHVTMTVRLPPDLDAQVAARLNEAEHEYAASLQRSGKWLHLWRVAGRYENVSIFEVQDPGELHELISALPLYPYMDVEVSALCHHPGAIAVRD
jgi:muconolactone D-isomerase